MPVEAGGGAVLIGPKTEHTKASLRTREPAIAKQRHSAALVYLERYWEALRSGPRHLTHKEVVALAGVVYRWLAVGGEDDPGPASLWEKVIRLGREIQEGKHGLADLLIDPTPEDVRRGALNLSYGPIADALLTSKALVVDEDSRWRLIQELHQTVSQAAEKLKRNAQGDYRPDPMAERFPEWQGNKLIKQPHPVTTITRLFEGWEREAHAANKSPKTIKEYGSLIERLKAFLGHDDATRVTEDDLIRWKDHRLAEGKSLKTIAHSDLACFKAVFGWGRANRLLERNPAKDITIKPGRKVQEREEKGFTASEARKILTAALSYKRAARELPETAHAKNWVPWLCAYTGARVGEIVQLRKQDIRREGNVWVATITPEAGAVKNKRARVVVVHSHLIELGFVQYAQSAKGPYLFLTAHNKEEALGRIAALKNRLAEFARALVPDKRVAPNHGWRHRFITVAREAEIADRVIYAITGHAPANVGGGYGDVTLKTQARALAKFPRYELNAPAQRAAE
jgi:integrase